MGVWGRKPCSGGWETCLQIPVEFDMPYVMWSLGRDDVAEPDQTKEKGFEGRCCGDEVRLLHQA